MAHPNLIAKITGYTVRRYSDSGQTVAYCEWLDDEGHKGRTEGDPNSFHMNELHKRSHREGIKTVVETW